MCVASRTGDFIEHALSTFTHSRTPLRNKRPNHRCIVYVRRTSCKHHFEQGRLKGKKQDNNGAQMLMSCRGSVTGSSLVQMLFDLTLSTPWSVFNETHCVKQSRCWITSAWTIQIQNTDMDCIMIRKGRAVKRFPQNTSSLLHKVQWFMC